MFKGSTVDTPIVFVIISFVVREEIFIVSVPDEPALPNKYKYKPYTAITMIPPIIHFIIIFFLFRFFYY
jgi:hypothetical protein